jgi:hypothetical protein
MARKTAVDRHPARDAIYRDIALGVSYRRIAKKYGIKNHDSVFRAKKNMPAEVARAILDTTIAPTEAEAEQIRAAERCALVPTLQVQRIRLLQLQEDASKRGDLRLAGKIATYIADNIETTAKIVGELAPTRTENLSVTVNSDQVLLLQVLQKFPEARDAVLKAINDQKPIAALPAPEVEGLE